MSQTNIKPDHKLATDTRPRTPLWVKVSGIIIAILIALVVVLHLTGNSFGPGMHTPPTNQGLQQP